LRRALIAGKKSKARCTNSTAHFPSRKAPLWKFSLRLREALEHSEPSEIRATIAAFPQRSASSDVLALRAV